jgi:hypothetical protein
LPSTAAQSSLNNLVAVSVALLAVFMSVTKVKDDKALVTSKSHQFPRIPGTGLEGD